MLPGSRATSHCTPCTTSRRPPPRATTPSLGLGSRSTWAHTSSTADALLLLRHVRLVVNGHAQRAMLPGLLVARGRRGMALGRGGTRAARRGGAAAIARSAHIAGAAAAAACSGAASARVLCMSTKPRCRGKAWCPAGVQRAQRSAHAAQAGSSCAANF